MDFKAMLGGMQKKMQEIKKKKENARYKGEAGGGMVSVTVNGDFCIVQDGIHIDKSLKGEELDIIADLFAAAYNNAHTLAQEDDESTEDELLKSFPMPFNMKKPF